MKRIVVIGTSGSGKTTLARQIAARLAIPHVELDALNWEANWQQASNDVFRQRVTDAVSGDTWVVDGNYGKSRDIVWPRADTVVWLDFPLYVNLWRIFWRGIRRSVSREDLWGTGNRETLRRHLFTRESLIWWVLQTHRRRRRENPVLFRQSQHAHLKVIHLKSSHDMESWLSNLRGQAHGIV
jgi:adenylate kinase family enzyme